MNSREEQPTGAGRVRRRTKNPDAPKKTVILAGRIHTGGLGRPSRAARSLIEDGKIVAVWKEDEVKIPDDAAILTAADVTPGLIDPFCVAGLTGAWNIPADQDQDELSDPNQADLRVYDGFNPREPLLEFLQANGITIVHTTPGRQNVIAGQSGIFRTDGATVESAAVKPVAAMLVNLGEVAEGSVQGEGPDDTHGHRGAGPQGVRGGPGVQGEGSPAAKNPKHEALVPALEGKIPVYFAAHRKDDIQTALRIAAEFKLKPVIALGTEAYRMADELKKAGVPVVVHPTMQRAGGEHGDAARLRRQRRGARRRQACPSPSALGSRGTCRRFACCVTRRRWPSARVVWITSARIRAVTIDAAKLLGIDKEYGSIEKGKVADLVLYDGDPFEHTTHVTHTVMAGNVVYNRADYLKLPFERRILPLLAGGAGSGCCMMGW